MTTTAKPIVNIAILDAALVAAACLVPAVSHLLAVPLYMLNPMLALLLAGMLVSGKMKAESGKWNALLLAVLMPVASCLIAGMPAAPKMVCMVAELAVVAALFGWLSRRWAVLPAVLAAVLAGKVVYYALTALVIAPAELVGTEWWIQLLPVMLWGGLFAMLYSRKK